MIIFLIFGFAEDTLGNAQINLALRSLIRIFDCVLDTSPQQNPNKFGFVFGLFVSLYAGQLVCQFCPTLCNPLRSTGS